MKPSLCALLFLFAFITSSAEAQFVVDFDGDNVVNGGTYYIYSYLRTPGGGLELPKKGNETCPLSVVQSPFEKVDGLPWKIVSSLKIGFVPTNTSLDFFSVEGKVPSCVPMPSKWSIVEGEDGIKSVEISGSENTIKGWFKIQKYSDLAYKIVFCPTNGDDDSCADLGIAMDDNGNRRLVISDDHTLDVVFLKVESSQV